MRITAILIAAGCAGGLGPARAAPDFELGRYLATECITCHRAAAPGAATPNVYGMEPRTFVQVIKAYRAKELSNPVMQTVTARLSDEDIDALAAFFAQARP